MDGIYEFAANQRTEHSQMISLAIAILRSFLRDKSTLLIALIAPIAFFLMFAIFYRHLDSPKGVQFQIALVSKNSPDADLFAEAILLRHDAYLELTRIVETTNILAADYLNFDAVIILDENFSRNHLSVEMVSYSPFPGISSALRTLVIATAAEVFAQNNPPLIIHDRTTTGGLLRSSTPGIPVLFVLIAISSLVARGIADEESGLADRICSLGVSRKTQILSRMIALTTLAFVQMLTIFLIAAAFFKIFPIAIFSLTVVTLAGSIALTSFITVLAGICRSRARFALIAPVATLILATLGGGIIPLKLLPPAIATLSNYSFTGWTTAACAQSIDGVIPFPLIGLLICFDVLMLCAAISLAPRRTST